MNKSEVCVKLTRKNCKKVLRILEMFGEPIWEHSKLKEGFYDYYPVFAMMQDGEWLVNLIDTGKALVKPRELRNILAKDEEKSSLEPVNQVSAKEVISPEQRFPLFPHQSYTREIWVNHYSDQEFHIHYNKEIAELHSRINNGFGKEAQTVKATLTYDIPMTKV